MRLVLIGQEHTKRCDYMRSACESLGISMELIEWSSVTEQFDPACLAGSVVKIDPPSYETIQFSDMQKQLSKYREHLKKMCPANCRFLNSPEAILRMLDKQDCKHLLQQEGVPVTRMFSEHVQNSRELLELMADRHCYSVFVKPRFFSGAAGVAAFRFHPQRRQMVLYTSCICNQFEESIAIGNSEEFPIKEHNILNNTKKLRRLDDEADILPLLDALLGLDCVVERWHPKAEYHGKSYDLRVVYQFGHIAHIVVRQSDSPITNLHLNNQALEFDALGLPDSTVTAIAEVCKSAVSGFSGLNMAGIDILLERGTLTPRIIEMNGQGDLIYQDIYGDNQIYREQVMNLCR